MRNHKFTTKECWGEAVSAMESACREELLPRIKTSFAIARVLTEITLEPTRVRSSWQEPCGGDEGKGQVRARSFGRERQVFDVFRCAPFKRSL